MSAGPLLVRPTPCFAGPGFQVRKAKKSPRSCASRIELRGTSVLETDTAAGAMAAHFASPVGPQGKVMATDVHDRRRTRGGFGFYQVNDVGLPFAGSEFDLIMYNNVIERVGRRVDQGAHLREIRRVLKPTGIAYCESHILRRPIAAQCRATFRLAFLRGLPRRLRSPYVLAQRGQRYDCDPLGYRGFRRMLNDVGFSCEGCAAQAIAAMAKFEWHRALVRLAARLPWRVLDALHPLMATLIFVARK